MIDFEFGYDGWILLYGGFVANPEDVSLWVQTMPRSEKTQ